MIIYGASGHNKVIHNMPIGNNIVFIDTTDKSNNCYNKPVFLLDNYNINNENIIILTGDDNMIQKQFSYRFNNYFNAIHPNAIISKSVEIDLEIAIIQNISCNADTIIGNYIILKIYHYIHHDYFINNSYIIN